MTEGRGGEVWFGLVWFGFGLAWFGLGLGLVLVFAVVLEWG